MKYSFTDPQGVSGYEDPNGIFFIVIDNKIMRYATCRDSIERRFQEIIAKSQSDLNGKVAQLAFKHANIKHEKLKAFWAPIFKKLGKESVVLFHTCNINNTIVVNLRQFWMQNQITRSIFTMLIRASCVYASFKAASSEYYILKDTLPAFNHFLEGNTKMTFSCAQYNMSFYSYFAKKDQATIEKLLVRP